MARIIGIDYGRKRVGIAVTDPLKIIASGLETVDARHAVQFLADYIKKEEVECIVVGRPVKMNNTESEVLPCIMNFVASLRRNLPGIRIEFMDERFTSKIALRAMIEGGMKKSERRKKENLDKISAALILQSFLEKEKNSK